MYRVFELLRGVFYLINMFQTLYVIINIAPLTLARSPLLLPPFGLSARGGLEQLPGGAALVPPPAAQAQARQPRPRGHRRGHRREALEALRTGTAAREVEGTSDNKVNQSRYNILTNQP